MGGVQWHEHPVSASGKHRAERLMMSSPSESCQTMRTVTQPLWSRTAVASYRERNSGDAGKNRSRHVFNLGDSQRFASLGEL